LRPKGAPRGRQVGARKANESKPLKTCRECLLMTSEPRLELRLGRSLGGDLLTAQAASGIKVVRAWFRLLHGTREPGASILGSAARKRGAVREGELQAEETARGRVPQRGTGAGRPVVVMKPGNAGGAKGTRYPGEFGGQPQGRSR